MLKMVAVCPSATKCVTNIGALNAELIRFVVLNFLSYYVSKDLMFIHYESNRLCCTTLVVTLLKYSNNFIIFSVLIFIFIF